MAACGATGRKAGWLGTFGALGASGAAATGAAGALGAGAALAGALVFAPVLMLSLSTPSISSAPSSLRRNIEVSLGVCVIRVAFALRRKAWLHNDKTIIKRAARYQRKMTRAMVFFVAGLDRTLGR
jgi:protein-S-isoprenylcysteine O-methyltransferase Ste14